MDALSLLDPASRAHVYWAGRLTLCASAEDVRRYDRVFAAYFGERPAALIRRPAAPAAQLRLVSMSANDATTAPGDTDSDATPGPAAPSSTEILPHPDIAPPAAGDRVPPAPPPAGF